GAGRGGHGWTQAVAWKAGERGCGADRLPCQWLVCARAFMGQRSGGFAGLRALFAGLFFLPPHLRRRAAARLNLKPGDRVLEIGCGTGRNFPFLREAVGRKGRVYGVDFSTGMLRRARALCWREQWTNVEL